MSNINGTAYIDLDHKTQNIDSATTDAGDTNFIGVLEVNGVPVASAGSLVNYLKRDGTNSMSGTLNMNTNPITNITTINGINPTQITTNATNITANTTAINLRLLKAGDTMSGTLNMGTNPISNITTINGVNPTQITTNATNITSNTTNIATNTSNITTLQSQTQNQSATAGNTNFAGTLQQAGVNVATTSSITNMVTNAGTGTVGGLPTFTTTGGKVLQDSTILLSSLATTSAMNTADNLRLLKTGDTMSGTLNMGTNPITGVTLVNSLTLPAGTDTLVGRATTDTLTNKTLTTPIISTISNTGTLTLPTSTDTLVGRATTDTLTNKTLTTPIIATISNTGTITLPTSTDTLVGRSTTDTLQNKTMTGTNNLITARTLRSGANEIDLFAATIPSSGQVLTATSGTAATWQTPASLANYVTGPASSLNNSIPQFSGTGGKTLVDSGINGGNIVQNIAGSTNNDICLFSGTTGRLITDGATAIGLIGAITLANTTDSSSTSTGTIICPGGGGIAKKLYVGDNIVIGPSQTRILDTKLTMQGLLTNIAGPHMTYYTTNGQYPAFQQLNWNNDNVSLNFDSYFDGTSWKSSYSGSNFQIQKTTNQLQFWYASGTAAGSTLTWTNAGYVDTGGILQWQKAIKSAATTASTSTSTGAIVSAGGLACAGALQVGTTCAIGKNAAPGTPLEVVGAIMSSNNGGLGDKEIIMNSNGAGSYAIISSYEQSVGDRDLQIGIKNLGIGTATPSFGGGYGCIFIANATTIPSSNQTGGGILYVSGGSLKFRGSSGTVTTIANA